MRPRLLFAIAAIAISVLVSGSASAAPIVYGTPVDAIGSSTQVGSIKNNATELGGRDAIEMYIPLTAGSSGTYGVDTYGSSNQYTVGLNQDNCYNGWNGGTCAGSMTMYLEFSGLDDPATSYNDVPGPYFMRFYFEDLDLIGANDPDKFLESITIKDQDGTVLGGQTFDTGGTTSVPTPPYGTNDYSYNILQSGIQELILYNVQVPTDPFYAELVFTAAYPDTSEPGVGSYHWRNTIEYMSAEVEAWPPELVPVPAALPLFLSGLAAMGFVGVRRNKKQKAENA